MSSINSLVSGGYDSQGNYISGSDPASYGAAGALDAIGSINSFQYSGSQYDRVTQAVNDMGLTPEQYADQYDTLTGQPYSNTTSPTASGTTAASTTAATATTAGEAIGGWLMTAITSPRFIVFAVGALLVIVAAFSLGIPQKIIAVSGKAAEAGA